ncbi:hypothetical protein H7K31_03510 [Mycolicibacterium bacteremicum]|nr:hypothetical protein [Mycolicibacterium bacteremicum]
MLGRRLCAVLAVMSAMLHLAMLGHAGNAALTVGITAMALACLYCGYELWRGGSLRIWCAVAVMSLAMVGAHWSLPGHRHGAVVESAAAPVGALMAVATAVSLAEAAIATIVLFVLTRRRVSHLV